MNTGQLLLSLGAIMLLSLVVLRQNGDYLGTGDSLLESKLGIMAVSEAASTMEQVSRLAFDEHSKDSTFTGLLSDLTPPGALGPDAGEDSVQKFNDIDDYNGYTRFDQTDVGDFQIRCRVAYIDPSSPDVDYTAGPTWHKKVTVTVFGPQPALKDSIQYSTILSYWSFR